MAANDVPLVSPYSVTAFSVPWYCEYRYGSVISKGFFQGDDPMNHTFILILLQLGTAIVMTTILRRILRLLNQPRFVAEMLAGVILGPSILQHFVKSDFFQSFHNPKQDAMMSFFEFYSIFMFTYLVGIQTDLNIIKSSGKLGWILGISTFVLPNIITKIVSTFLAKYHPGAAGVLKEVAMFCPITSFPVTVILLQDIKLLNSEIGRLAISSSIISNVCGWLYTSGSALIMFATLFKYTTWDYIKATCPRFLYIFIAIFMLRPIMYWMIKQIPEGKSLKQWQFVAMITMVFTAGFFNESLGYSALFGANVLGLVVPSGPPLGSGMADKCNLFVTRVLVPSYLLAVGNRVDVYLLTMKNCWLVMLIIVSATVGKVLAVTIPMKVFGVPNKDAFALGLILSSQGFFDVIVAKNLVTYGQITPEFFTIIVLMIMLNAFIGTPILRHIYDPSKRYINYKRRTIQHSRHEPELKALVCIHEEDDAFGIMNILKAIYPTNTTPIIMYVLDLMELVGRLTPIFINHHYHRQQRSPAATNRTERIISAFKQFECQNEGLKRHNFTAIAPYNSMHDEICTLALTKSVSLLIIPFHKSETIPMRGVKRNVLEKAPCSVGILVDKRIVLTRKGGPRSFHVCVVFLGGPDAREALALAMRMLENPSTRITIIRLIAEDEFVSNLLETKLDVSAITEVKTVFGEEGRRVVYKEVVVKDGAHTIEVLRSIDDEYDLMLVGRRLDADSPLVAGLVDWTYESELGIVGDVLASADLMSTTPVLVIQQQSTVEDLLQIDRVKKLA